MKARVYAGPTVTFLTGYGKRPLHLLGGIGLVAFLLGGLGLSYLAVIWLLTHLWIADLGPIGQRPMLIYSVAGVLLGFQMLAIGFLAELMSLRRPRTSRENCRRSSKNTEISRHRLQSAGFLLAPGP